MSTTSTNSQPASPSASSVPPKDASSLPASKDSSSPPSSTKTTNDGTPSSAAAAAAVSRPSLESLHRQMDDLMKQMQNHPSYHSSSLYTPPPSMASLFHDPWFDGPLDNMNMMNMMNMNMRHFHPFMNRHHNIRHHHPAFAPPRTYFNQFDLLFPNDLQLLINNNNNNNDDKNTMNVENNASGSTTVPTTTTTTTQPVATTTTMSNANNNTSVAPTTTTNTSLLSPSSWIYPTMVNVDVHEEKDNFKITAELPGVSRDNIRVSVNDGYLTISGHKKEEKEEEEMKQDDEPSAAATTTTTTSSPSSSSSPPSSSSSSSLPTRVCRRSERRYGSFERSFRLPANCEIDDQLTNINAKYDNNGVLIITIPKISKQQQKEKQNKNIQIQ